MQRKNLFIYLTLTFFLHNAYAEDSIDKGKATYETVCAACHGSGIPGIPQLGDGAAWTQRIEQGKETLYEHAINGFTGSSGMPMPARGSNPDLSDDEVKAAVDYIVANSEGSAPPTMQAVPGLADSSKQKSQTCAACHGADGNSTNPAWPNLAGQHANYIRKQLMDFKSGARVNAQMSPMVQGLSEEDMADLGTFYASQKSRQGKADSSMLQLGKKVYRAGNIEAGVPACLACHGPTGRGNPAAMYPALSGQHAAYTRSQLNAFRNDARANDSNEVMRSVVDRMTDEEVIAVSEYIQGLH